MKDNLDQLLTDTLKADLAPDAALNRQIIDTWLEEGSTMKQGIRKKRMAAIVFAVVLCVGSMSAYAAYHYLQPSQVALELGGDEDTQENRLLAEVFAEDNAVVINETQQSNGYNITLLGVTSGASLSPYVVGQIDEVKTYAVLAIERMDGTEMGDGTLCISPLINGVSWMIANNATLNLGLSWFTQDNVQYAMIECDNLEIFADRGVLLGVVDYFGSEGSAFTMDEATGVYCKNETYQGTNALFTLPLDEGKADHEAAEKYLKELADDYE